MGLFDFSKPIDPKEQIKEWKHKLRGETRNLDRQIRAIEREEDKIKQSVRDAAKKGHMDICKTLAKSLVQSRKAKNRILVSKTQINSVLMEIQANYSMSKVAGAMKASTAVMQGMSALVRMPEIQATMQELAQEMTKAGIMEEMMDDTMESLDEDDVEEEANAEVDAILFEVTNGMLGQASAAGSKPLEVETAPVEVSTEDISARLNALRS